MHGCARCDPRPLASPRGAARRRRRRSRDLDGPFTPRHLWSKGKIREQAVLVASRCVVRHWLLSVLTILRAGGDLIKGRRHRYQRDPRADPLSVSSTLRLRLLRRWPLHRPPFQPSLQNRARMVSSGFFSSNHYLLLPPLHTSQHPSQRPNDPDPPTLPHGTHTHSTSPSLSLSLYQPYLNSTRPDSANPRMLAPLSLFLALLSVASVSVSVSAAPMPYSHSSSYLSTAVSSQPQAPNPTGLSNSIPNSHVHPPANVRVVQPRLQARRVVVSRWAEAEADEEQGERERDIQEVPTGVYVSLTFLY